MNFYYVKKSFCMKFLLLNEGPYKYNSPSNNLPNTATSETNLPLDYLYHDWNSCQTNSCGIPNTSEDQLSTYLKNGINWSIS